MSNEIFQSGRRDFLKGVVIGAGGYALGSMVVYPKEAMAQSIESYLQKVPMEDRWNLASGSTVAYSVNSLKLRYDQGSKEKFLEYMKQIGQRLGAGYKGFADRYGLTGNDAKSAAAIIPAMITVFWGSQQKFEIEEATVDMARVKCINCTFWNAVQAQKITDDLCSSLSLYSWEGRAKAINPKLTSTLVKARPRGDSVCEWVVELKA